MAIKSTAEAIRTGFSLYLRNGICQLDISRLCTQYQASESLQLVNRRGLDVGFWLV
jgi:hypothetical protein